MVRWGGVVKVGKDTRGARFGPPAAGLFQGLFAGSDQSLPTLSRNSLR